MDQASSTNNYLYNKYLKEKACVLRATMTKAEACIWKYALQGRQLKGYQFRRQRPVMNYIVDFMCQELDLIIEIDGITHSYEPVAENDRIRQKNLEVAGFTVLRFSDEEILESIDRVKMKMEDWIDSKEKSTPCPRLRGTETRLNSDI